MIPDLLDCSPDELPKPFLPDRPVVAFDIGLLPALEPMTDGSQCWGFPGWMQKMPMPRFAAQAWSLPLKFSGPSSTRLAMGWSLGAENKTRQISPPGSADQSRRRHQSAIVKSPENPDRQWSSFLGAEHLHSPKFEVWRARRERSLRQARATGALRASARRSSRSQPLPDIEAESAPAAQKAPGSGAL